MSIYDLDYSQETIDAINDLNSRISAVLDQGTNGADTFAPNETRDFRYHGRKGNDDITGNSGNDLLAGNQGEDVVRGGAGDDLISGGGSPTDDLILTFGGSDPLVSGQRVDTLHGDAGNDILFGELGDDHLYGGTGNDLLLGGQDDDYYYFEQGHGQDTIEDTSGITRIEARYLGGLNLVNGTPVSPGVQFLANGNDLIISSFGSPQDTITIRNFYLDLPEILISIGPGDGDAQINTDGILSFNIPGAPFILAIDGAGLDNLSGTEAAERFAMQDDNIRDLIRDFDLTSDKVDVSALGIENFEDLTITNDVRESDGFIRWVDVADGEGIEFSMRFAAGETLDASALTADKFIFTPRVFNVDTSVPGQIVFPDNVTDVSVAYDAVSQEIVFSAVDEIVKGDFCLNEAERSTNQYIFENGVDLDNLILVGLDGVQSETNAARKTFDGRSSTEDLWVIGRDGQGDSDIIYTGSGDDVIEFYGGSGSMGGGAGNDTYIFGKGYGQVRIDPRQGIGETANSGEDDTILLKDLNVTDVTLAHYSQIDEFRITHKNENGATEYIRIPEATLPHIENIVFADGTQIGNILLGDNNIGVTQSFRTIAYGSNGDDWLVAGIGVQDRQDLVANAGDDFIFGSAHVNLIQGNDGNDTIYAGASNDDISGGNGDDIIFGQAGNDVLRGNDGADVFVFDQSEINTSRDDELFNNNRLADFSVEDGDVIRFENLLEGFDPLSGAISDFVQLVDISGQSRIQVDRDGGGDDFETMIRFTEAGGSGAVQVDFTIDDLINNGNLEIV